MTERYIRLRQILGAPGKGHKYQAKLHVLDCETDIIKTYPHADIPIAGTSVRILSDPYPWEIQRPGCGCGWSTLSKRDLEEINSHTLNILVEGNNGADEKEAD